MTPTETKPRNKFTSETASAAGKKSAQKRRERNAAVKQASDARKHDLRSFVSDNGVENLGQYARIATAELVHRVLIGEVACTNARDVASLVKEMHAIARLELGQPTSYNVSASLSPEALDAAALALRQRVMDARGVNGKGTKALPVDAMQVPETEQVDAVSHDADTTPPPSPSLIA